MVSFGTGLLTTLVTAGLGVILVVVLSMITFAIFYLIPRIAGNLRSAKALQAGVISVNSNSSVHTEAPFGGYKMSGIGRELGMSALDLYTETKNIFIDLR